MNNWNHRPHGEQSPTVALLGRNVGHWRRVRGLSVAELAERAEISAKLLRAIEAGEHDPGIDLLDRLAKALAVTPRQLLIQTIIGALSVDKPT